MIEDIKKKFSEHVRDLQNQITEKMQYIDPNLSVDRDLWTRKDFIGNDGGGGDTRAFSGDIFENAGVNTSEIFGAINPEFATQLQGSGDQLWATGISLIIHPLNPKIPTVHMNFRMIQHGDKHWFGGGADLTPFYPFEEDFHYFHQVWKDACAPYGVYEDMKKKCDEYFTNKHRDDEMRGIGGIFYDHFNTGDLEKDFNMTVDLSNHFIKSYFPIVEKRVKETFDTEDEDFQLHRRGRYVEFNLIHDRGTLFGLKTNGRVDSILISLPARCKYTYKYEPTRLEHKKMWSYYFPQDW